MELDHRISRANGTHGSPENSLFETVSKIQHDLNDVIGALALLGIKRCCQCQQFFSCSEPGMLFDYGKLVCYACVPDWWPAMSAKLSVNERERLETKLSSWLRRYHEAAIVRQEIGKISEHNPQQFQIVVRCNECLGSGKLLEGERCRFCNGFGTVCVVAPK